MVAWAFSLGRERGGREEGLRRRRSLRGEEEMVRSAISCVKEERRLVSGFHEPEKVAAQPDKVAVVVRETPFSGRKREGLGFSIEFESRLGFR